MMGMHGGARRVTVWRCTSCQRLYDRSDGGRKSAVECCNEMVEEADRQRKKKICDRWAKKVTVAVLGGRGVENVARAQCPRCSRYATIKIGQRDWYGQKKRTRDQTHKMARALALAQMKRHIQSHARWE